MFLLAMTFKKNLASFTLDVAEFSWFDIELLLVVRIYKKEEK